MTNGFIILLFKDRSVVQTACPIMRATITSVCRYEGMKNYHTVDTGVGRLIKGTRVQIVIIMIMPKRVLPNVSYWREIYYFGS